MSLAAELEALGAPAELVVGCRDTARDEVAHAGMVAAVAAQRGVAHPALAALGLPSSAEANQLARAMAATRWHRPAQA